jgi:phenylacetate-CoA ligase
MHDLTPSRASLDPIEIASRDEIAGLQLARLKATLRHVYDNVPHYWKAFDAAGVHPDDVHTLADLARFPFTAKADLRDNYPFGLFAVPREEVIRLHASSGTTGKPTVVGYTRADIEMWSDVMARSIRASGGRPGMRVHVAYGYGLFTGGLGAHYGVERLGCTVIPVSGGMTERQVQLIQDFEPDLIMVTPSYALAILDEFRKQGVDPRKTSLKAGIFGAEPWTNSMRAEIEQSFDMHAVDIYGLSEVIGPGVACECVETKDGLHIWEDHFYPEIIDPVSGKVLPDGEIGELVFTSLTKQAMPIIRYRTRDLTRLLPGTARSMRRMEKVTGRSDDMMIVRGVNVFPTQIEELILKLPALSAHYQVLLTREDRLDEMEILVERRDDATLTETAAAGERLKSAVKETIGVTAEVRIVPPHGIERSTMARPRALDYDDKRRAILARSAELFAHRGFQRTSMAEIADACGISKGLFYHYYASKEQVLADMMTDHLERLEDTIAGADDGAAAPELRLAAIVRALLSAYADRNALHKVQMNELAALPDSVQADLKAVERRLVARVAVVIALINPALGRQPELLKPVTMSLFGMLNWHHTWFRDDGPLTRETYADLATELMISGVRTMGGGVA